jgi:C_GCAxxG_C_C family probable redox protein
MIKEKAIEYHRQGFSCSESVVKAAIDEGYCADILLPAASSFSGGMGSGCLCGAIAGAQMVLGSNFGTGTKDGSKKVAVEKASTFINKFKENHKATCCRVLSAGFEAGSPERRQNCEKLVGECAENLQKMLNEKAAV